MSCWQTSSARCETAKRSGARSRRACGSRRPCSSWRGCVRDVEIGGCPIPAGTRVITGFASANRDERVFDDPDEFRLDRPNSEHHLTFGYGARVPGRRARPHGRAYRHPHLPRPLPERDGSPRARLRVRERADLLRARPQTATGRGRPVGIPRTLRLWAIRRCFSSSASSCWRGVSYFQRWRRNSRRRAAQALAGELDFTFATVDS